MIRNCKKDGLLKSTVNPSWFVCVVDLDVVLSAHLQSVLFCG